jgi:hypothetical protein
LPASLVHWDYVRSIVHNIMLQNAL